MMRPFSGKLAKTSVGHPSVRLAHKEIQFSNGGRQALLGGVDILARAVSVTMGPKGRTVIIEQPFGGPKITKDGVTVAKAIQLKDKFENLGARLIQDVASKTNDEAGDGTTTATVLARSIYADGVKNVAAGCNPMDLRRGTQRAVDAVLKYIEENKRLITTTDEIAQVATISANGDHDVGALIAQAMEKVGKEGVITVKEGKAFEDEIEVTEGMRFDRGYVSPYFVTDIKTQKVEFEKPFVLLSEKKISAVQDVLPALEIAAQARRPLLVVAEDIDGEALAACILNRLRGQLQVAVVRAPGYGDNRKSILGDIGVLTGGLVFSEDTDMKLDKLTVNDLGEMGSCTITKEDTVILNGAGQRALVNERCELIRDAINDPSTSEYDRTKLRERLAKLSGGVAVLRVGGSSEVEVGERKDRFDDALNATFAAVDEGIVPGGGTALLKATSVLKGIKGDNFDQNVGVDIIASALSKPIRTIAENAGEEGSVIVGNILQSHIDNFNVGWNAADSTYVDMLQAGIIDPAKVVKTALVDAAGVASLLTTSEACIIEAPEDKPAPPPMGGGGMGGLGGGMF